MRKRVAMIGLDAAEWWIVEKFVREGEMPNLDKLLSKGRFGLMEAPPAFKAEGRWAEVLTGRTADENQYWSIVGFDPVTYLPWYQRSNHGTYFYARPDLTSIVFDVPNSVIVEDVHGIQITAWGAHAAQFPSASQPNHVLPDVDRKFGVHEALLSDGHTGWHNDTYLANLQDAMDKGIRQRVEISSWLQEQSPDWDLFFTVFAETHVGEHQFLHGVIDDHPLHDTPYGESAADHLRRTFTNVDTAIGELVEQLDESTTVVVFACHGMQSNRADALGGVLIPEILHRQTFGSPMIEFEPWDGQEGPLVLNERVLARHYLESRLVHPTPVTSSGLRSIPKRAVRRFKHLLPMSALGRFEKLYWRRPDWWEMQLRSPAPYRSRDLFAEAARQESEAVVATSWYRPYWSKMQAFVIPSFSDCHIRLNVKGRERDGVIAEADYDRVCDEVETFLRKITDARTGEPVVDEVLRLRKDDPMAAIGPAPDLVVSFTHVADVVHHPDVGTVGRCPLMRMGEHTPHGWAVISTPDGAVGDLGSFEPRDLTATVIDLLGVPAAPTTTGRSLIDGE
ncbi:MAG: alkaline phosphatase family protein [Solirubrobacterales bacterium]